MDRSLVWFRNDLRVHDNEALSRSVGHDEILPVYIFDPRHFGKTSFGFDKTGPHRLRFLLESVANLRENIQHLGGDLIIKKGKPEEVIPALITDFDVQTLYYHTEEAWEEQQVEQALIQAIDIDCRSFHGSTLFHPDDIPYEPQKIPKTFTNFRKQVEKKSSVRECFPNPDKITIPDGVQTGKLPSIDEFGTKKIEADKRSVLAFTGGERSAAKRLKHYFWDEDQLKSYKFTRNGLMGANYSSKFSPWLANGSLSPRKIYWQVKQYEKRRKSNVSTYWMVFELIWRDYFHFSYLRHGTDFFKGGGIQRKERDWDTDQKLFDKWANAETGIPFIDANMCELNRTGFMSNRGRQNVASFLSQNLNIDWRMGAEYFESKLIDYDVYSNYGNWMYNATVGHDSRNRYFNIVKQAQKYDSDGEYVKYWLPILESIPDQKVHEPHTLSAKEEKEYGVVIGKDYPKPIIDLDASYETIKARN